MADNSHRRALRAIEYPLPCPEVTPLSKTGTVTVRGTVDAGTNEVFALVYRKSQVPQNPPASPPSNATPGQVIGGTTFTVPDVPGFLGNLNGTSDDNVLTVWSRIPNTPWDSETTEVCGHCLADATVEMAGKECVWFAWFPLNQQLTGPQGEIGDSYRPVGLTVPQDATQVTLSAQGSWRHDPSSSRASGPDGLNGQGGIPNDQRGLEVNAYRSDVYNSLGIEPITTHLNKLIALWEIAGEPGNPAQPQTPEIIGSGNQMQIPDDATRLFLAFHDGREWSNNSGGVSVQVTWQG